MATAHLPAVGTFGYGMIAANTSVDVGAPVDDIATISINAQSNVGLEPIINLAFGSVAVSGTGTIVDYGAATAAGGSAYMQCIALNAGTLDLSIRHSTDNFAGDDTELVAFTQIAGGGVGERVTFAGTVKRYVRAKWVLAGGATLAIFEVAYYRA
jgi:hypothetical protein